MNYIIGDLHANVEELRKLLALINPRPDDALIFVGDYVDKNIFVPETLALLWELHAKHTCIFLKGNHDYVWERYLNFGDTGRQEFLLTYGGVETLKLFSDDPAGLLERNEIAIIKKYLASYLDLLPSMRDYYLVGDYLALHAGLLPQQMNQQPLIWSERNYFIRPDDMNLDKRYLNTYTLVAGHTHISDEPWRKNGYINIDLGAAYGKFLGAFVVEEQTVIRSDGKLFPI